MSKKRPFVLSIVGRSDSGKTTLIMKILPELKKKGLKVAIAKHCPCGFDLDREGKDSWKFTQSGGEGTFLSSKENIALIRPKEKELDLKERLKSFFPDFDIVLMEGYNEVGGIDKVQVFREEIGGDILSSEDVKGYVSDAKIKTSKPVYNPDDITGIIEWLIK